MSEAEELKACVNCEHHFHALYADFCDLHRYETVSYTRGEVASNAYICEFAREDEDLCGPDAKDYVHRGPEPKPSSWATFKSIVKSFF